MASSQSSKSTWAFLICGLVIVILAFVIGILIGIYAIPHKNDAGQFDAYLNEADEKISDLFMDAVNAKNIEKSLEILTSKIHRAGTPEGHEVAQFIHDSMISYGLDKVEFEEYDVLLSYPNVTNPDTVSILDTNGKVTMISDGHSKTLVPDEENKSPNADIRFLGFSKAGEVTAKKLVYANYGTPTDFDYLLNKANISIEGAIVMIKYRKLWRGAKVQFAEKFGAAGVLLFSDPQEETYHNQTSPEATYPNTVYMPSTAVQRGTIVYYDWGDLLTPLLPSKDYVIRHDIQEMYNNSIISKIPATPISYGDVQKLLTNMEGPEAPSDWQGGLPVKYRLGPNLKDNQSIKLTVSTYPESRKIKNVIGYIRGSVEPDRYVILGNHHDAWVYGAIDPSSGTAVMLEVARAFVSVKNSTGWRPRRTLVFCAWDAEEYGLVGSSEFVEQYLRRLESKTIAYLNVDQGASGNETIWTKSVPMLKKALFHAASKVSNPDKSEIENGRKTVYDTWLYRKPDKKNPSEPWIDSIGSGSDFRHFLDFAGISALDFRYTNVADRSYPLYHTMHETMHLIRLIDPTFVFQQATARMWGEMGRYLADSLIIPFNTSDYGKMMLAYIEELQKFIQNSPVGSYANITHMKNAGKEFLDSTIAFDIKVSSMMKNKNYDATEIRIINDRLMHLERMFILPFGLPGRSYLRHVIFAPSLGDVYSGTSFAGITDTMNELANAKNDRKSSPDHIEKLIITLRDQISWVANCLHSAVDLLTRDI